MILEKFRKHEKLAQEAFEKKRAATEEAERKRKEQLAKRKAKEEAEIQEITDAEAEQLQIEIDRVCSLFSSSHDSCFILTLYLLDSNSMGKSIYMI